MSVAIAFIGIIIIWSTTPLAIQWSSDGVGFIFGVTARMTIGALLCVLILLVLRRRLPMHLQAYKTYVAAASGIYGAMLCVYWGAQFVPSGLIAVLFGLTPIVSAFMAHIWLNENSLTIGKLSGAVLGFLGVFMIFHSDLKLNADAIFGVISILFAVIIHSCSSIWVKKVGVRMPALELTAGSLIVVVPFYFITWFFIDGTIPSTIPIKAANSILYLGVVGSVVGFTLFYYILRMIEANRVALVTLVTPVLALFIGQIFNNEEIPTGIWLGSMLIIAALVCHQWADQIFSSVKKNVIKAEAS